ncbi:hypothetical protein B0H66DRAFT_601645 [Apodospora peruviana]|uniref:MAPEG family protein n=1 Tax=Apodospora peruviana TaxID=516989 RepID=A0AAE0IBN8_9PEZI|nr:hypothetical protein B0H66DRAFT_601645 [Apodospora peruviana]
MASLIDINSTNWSLYSIPAAFALVMIPHFYANTAAGKNYDLANPGKTLEHLAKDTTFNKAALARITRAKAAVNNGFETLAFFAGGVVAANAAGVPTAKLNKLALGYLASRVLYNYVYVILQDNKKFAGLRSLIWIVGVSIIFALYISAGNLLNAKLAL